MTSNTTLALNFLRHDILKNKPEDLIRSEIDNSWYQFQNGYWYNILKNKPEDLIRSEINNSWYQFQNGYWYKIHFANGKLNFERRSDPERQSKRLRHVFSIDKGDDLLVVTFEERIGMYNLENGYLAKIFDRNIGMKTNDILFGRFYHDLGRMGALVIPSNEQEMVRIFEIGKKEDTFDFVEIATENSVLNQFCPDSWEYELAYLKKDSKQMIIKRNETALCAFGFNKDKKLQPVHTIWLSEIHGISKNDKIFFANLSGNRHWMDVIVFNSNGMFVSSHQKDLPKLINYNLMFSFNMGWTDKYTETVKFLDIDSDGFDDVIFTGRSGIEILSYDVHRNLWRSLLNTEELVPEQRHSSVLDVMSPMDGNAHILSTFLHHSNEIAFAEITVKPAKVMESSSIHENFSLELNGTAIVPEKILLLSEKPRSINYLRDHQMWFRKLASINPETGKPYFILPLVGKAEERDDKSSIKFDLSYDASKSVTKPFGLGWSTAQNFIAMNYEDGNFIEDESYVLVIENIPHQLEWISQNLLDGNEIEIFEMERKIDGTSKMKIRAEYNRTSSTWIVDYGTGRQQIYGNFDMESGASITDIGWNNWRGKGFDETDTVERANMWYLALNDNKGVQTSYQYEIIRKQMLEKETSYVAGVFVKKIHNIFSEIDFFYRNDSDGTNNFHLSNYTYKTKSTEQKVHFKYSTINDIILLTAIEQESDYIAQPVVQFEYCEPSEEKYLIEKITLPTGTEIMFTYDVVGQRVPINESTSKSIPVSDDYNVSYGPGFTLVSYISEESKQVILRMFNNAISEEFHPFLKENISPTNVWPPMGQNATAHEILLGKSYLAVVVYSLQTKFVYLFGRREDGTWMGPPLPFEYSEETTVLKGNHFIIVFDPYKSNIFVIEWKRPDSIWQSTPVSEGDGPHRAIAVHENKFLFYDNKKIYLGFKKLNTNWIVKEIVSSAPGYLSDTSKILARFDLKSDFNSALFGFFRNNAIQLHHNLVVLTALNMKNRERFVTIIKTFIIGRNHNIVNQHLAHIDQDMFSNIESDLEMNSTGDSFTMKYSYEKGLFKIILGSFQSPTGYPRTQFSEKVAKDMNLPAKRFLLDLKKYYVSLLGQTIECRNVKLTFGGVRWHRSEIGGNTNFKDSLSVLLGDRFTVNKTNIHSNVKLYDASNNQELFDLQVKEVDKVHINYPIYMASQPPNGGQITVIEFIDGKKAKFVDTKLSASKKLSPFGNALSLITHENHSNGSKTLHIWPLYDFRRFLPNIVANSTKTILPGHSGGSKQRITAYAYEDVSNQLMANDISYNSLSVFPGNNTKSFGYFTVTAKSVNYFNGEQKLVKVTEKENGGENSEGENNGESTEHKKETTLYSSNGRFEIASFAPFPISSEMSGFIGFEDYESPSANWIFDKSKIIKDRFSLTGTNYLHLDSSILKGKFRPKYQDRQFVISCWIRTAIENLPKLGDVVPFLTAGVLMPDGKQILNSLASVKYQIRDWSYLEVILDLQIASLILESVDPVALSNTSNFQVHLCVSKTLQFSIEVDHVRFSPLNNIFDVNVYDEEINQPLAVIKPNGAITRQFYDKYGEKIAEMNESNQISEFRTYTKGSYRNLLFGNPACVVRVTPLRGFYSDFSSYDFRSQWSLTDGDIWASSSATLRHFSEIRSFLSFKSPNDIDINSSGIRFLYSLTKKSSIIISDLIEMRYHEDSPQIFLISDKTTKQTIPVEGEILLIKEEHRVIVWVDGGLYIDQSSTSPKSIVFTVEGDIKLQQMMIFDRPKVSVDYKNALDQNIQQISLISATVAVIREMLYDELGRQAITVQPVEIVRPAQQSLMAYHADLVKNGNPSAADSVWQTGKLKGAINAIVGHEYGFSQIVYDNNPLNIRVRIGLPGKDFSTKGLYARTFHSSTTNFFIQNTYPSNKNFTYDVQDAFADGGGERISVFDAENNKVASLIHVKNGEDLFSTFEYNKNGSMTKCRPPMFYSKYGKFEKTTLDLYRIPNEIPHQHPLDIRIIYDTRGNPTHKFTPDMGPLENKYDDEDRLRFIIQHCRDKPTVVESITYLLYDEIGRLVSTGALRRNVEKSYLFGMAISSDNAKEFQRFYYSDTESEAAFRGKISRTLTMKEDVPIHEESIHDVEGNLVSKRLIMSTGNDKPMILSINKRYESSRLKEIIYPATMFGKIFRVAYEYDKLGRMTSVGIPTEMKQFMIIMYNANNQISSEYILPLHKHRFVRQYKYNHPGYLTEISDPFLSEEISYKDLSYSRQPYGDGKVTRVRFVARWHHLSSGHGIGVNPDSFHNNVITLGNSRECFNELKREGYLNNYNRQSRVFYPNIEDQMSFACTAGPMRRRVNEILGMHGFPDTYGYRFDYGPHGELKIGKYFVGKESEEPELFQSNIFSNKIDGIDEQQSKEIWKLLETGGYNAEGYRLSDEDLAELFIRKSLVQDLKSENSEFLKFAPLIRKLLLKQFTRREFHISVSRMERIFPVEFPNKTTHYKSIFRILSDKDYLRNPIDPNFIRTLRGFQKYVHEILDVIQRYQGMMERTEFDMGSKEVDANGNRVKFNCGYEDYHLQYETDSNRIRTITRSRNMEGTKEYPVEHDNRGNVIRALHRGIKSMEYHSVSNRLQKAQMANGDNIFFDYDSKGERILKRVTNQKNQTTFEKHYLRDEGGRILVERILRHMAENQKPDLVVTMFIYGPKNLIGFVRRDQFYSVFTDHQGSVRLVVRDGEVVAAYDYMPYGRVMRIFGNNPDAHISYRYNGQEYDDELGLYNYHARFYDPIIGRFYQIDPKMQYFSPYKYAGNSPLSMVDLSGSFGFLVILAIIGFTLLGAYLAGAAANDDFNILNWDWSKRDTYLAIFVGGVTGALIPLGFVGSLAALSMLSTAAAATIVTSIGLSTMYLSLASKNSDLNPGNWDYESPKTWWAAFEGFSLGVGILSGTNEAKQIFIALSRRGKYIFGGSVALFGGISTTMAGSRNNWKLDKPQFWYSLVAAIVSAADLPLFGLNSFKFIRKYGAKVLIYGKVLQQIKRMNNSMRITEEVLIILRGLGRNIGKILLGVFGVSAILATLIMLSIGDFENFDITKLSTYHNLINSAQITHNAMLSTQGTIKMTREAELMPPELRALVVRQTSNLAESVARARARIRFRTVEENIDITQTSSLVAFSAKPLLHDFIYIKTHLTNPFFYINDKGKILNINLLLHEVRRTIGVLQDRFERFSNDQFLNENVSQWKIGNKTLKDVVNAETLRQCEKIVKELFQSDTRYISPNLLRQTLHRTYFENKQIRKNVAKLRKIENYEKQLNSTNLSIWKRNHFVFQKKYFETEIKNLKSNEIAEDDLMMNHLYDIMWSKLEEHENSLVKWQISNSAEPPIGMLLAFSNDPLPTNMYFPNPNGYESSEDLKFLSSYDLNDLPQMTGFRQCYTCIHSTPKTRTTVRDIGWLALLNWKHKTEADVVQQTKKKKRRSIVSGLSRKTIELKNESRTVSSQTKDKKHSSFSGAEGKNASGILTDQFFSQLATNETLFLAEVLLAKCKKRKMFKQSASNNSFTFMQKEAIACEMMELLDEVLETCARSAGIEIDRLDRSNIYELYEKLNYLIRKGKYEEIFNLMRQHALKTSEEMSSDEQMMFGESLERFNLNFKIEQILMKHF